MYRLLIVALFGLTVAHYEKPYFEGGQQYLYKYETQVVNGVPGQSRTYSVFKITANVSVHLQTQARFVCQPENVEIRKFNGRMEEIDPTNQQVPLDKMQPLSQEEQRLMTQCFINEFKFTYDRGQVREFFADPSQPHWCTNYQRGFVNMFQVNFQPSKVISKEQLSAPNQQWGQQQNSYTIMEESPVGECETQYEIHEPLSDSYQFIQVPHLKVTKIRNFKNCVQQPIFFIDNQNSRPCSDCEKDEPLQSTSRANIIVSGDRTHFKINKAVIESKYFYAPHSVDQPSAVTIINQTLTLEDSVHSSYQPSSQRMLQPQSLIAEIPERDLQLSELQGFQQHQQDLYVDNQMSSKKVTKAQEIIKFLSKQLESRHTPIGEGHSCALDFVIDILRNMTHQECQKLNSEISTQKLYSFSDWKSSQNKEKWTLLRLLAQAGTPAAIDVIVKDIQAQQVPIDVAQEVIRQCSHHVHLPSAIKKLMELETCQYAREAKFSHELYLCIASCINNMHVKQDKAEQIMKQRVELMNQLQQISVSNDYSSKILELKEIIKRMEDTREQIEREFIRIIEKLIASSSQKDKIFGLSYLMNVGIKKNIEIVKDILKVPTQSHVLQGHAVGALYGASKKYPKEVLDILLSVYLNKKYTAEARIVAADFITDIDAPLPLWETLARAQRNETDVRVSTYIYNKLLSISNATLPCYQSMAKKAKLVQQWLKPVSDHSSMFVEQTIYDDLLKRGYSVSLRTMGSRRSYIPQAAGVVVSTLRNGQQAYNMELFYETDNGVEDIVDKFLGPASLFKRSKSQGRKPFQTDLQTDYQTDYQKKDNSYVQQLKDELKIRSQQYPQQSQGYLTLRIQERTVALKQFDLPSILQSLSSNKPVDVVLPQLWQNKRVIKSTECGLPVVFDYKVTNIMRVKGNMSSNLDQVFTAQQLQMDIDIKPTVSYQTVTQLGVDATIVKASVLLRNPLNVDKVQIASRITFDKQTQKVKASLEMPQQEKIVLESRGECETNIVTNPIYGKNFDAQPEMRVIVATDNSQVKPFKYVLPQKIFGVKASLVGEAPSCEGCTCPWMQQCTLNGRHMAFLKLEPDNAPEKLELVAQYASSNQFEGQGQQKCSGRMCFLYSSKQQNLLNLRELKEKLQVREVPNSNKYGLNVRLDKVSYQQQQEMVLETNVLCQRSQVGKKDLLCASDFERVPMWKNEQKNWKAQVKVNIEQPTEKLSVENLFRPEFVRELNQQLDTNTQICALRPDVMKWLKSEHMTIWERIVKNQTYAQSLYNDQSIWQQQPQQQPQQQYQSQPEVRELSQQLDILTSQQRQLMSQLQKLRIIAFSHNPEYLMDRSELSELVRKTEQNIRFVTRQLQQIQSKQRVLQSQQPTDEVEYVLSKLQHTVSQQRRIVDKFEYSHFTSLIKLQHQVQFIEQELQKQKQLCREIQQQWSQIRQRQSWSNDQDQPETENLEKVILCQSKKSEIKNIFWKQVACSQKIQNLIKQIQNQPSQISHTAVTRDVQEVMQKLENIKDEIKSIVQPVLSKSQSSPFDQPSTNDEAWRLASAISLLAHQEMILRDVKEPVIYCLMKQSRRSEPWQSSTTHSLKVKRDELLYNTIDLIASVQKAAEWQVRQIYSRMQDRSAIPASTPNTLNAFISAQFGESSMQTVSASIVGMKSLKQVIWEKNQLHQLTRDPRVSQLLKLLQTKGSKYYQLLQEIEQELNTFRKVFFNIKYSENWLIQQNEGLATLLRYMYLRTVQQTYPQFHTTLLQPNEAPKDNVYGWAHVSNDGKTLDARMLKTNQVSSVNSISIPSFVQYILPTVSKHHWTPFSKQCNLWENTIKTFDEHTYTLPTRVSPTCEKALAVDCTDNNALAVTVHKHHQTLKTVVKVVLNRHIVEVQPNQYQPTVKINNELIDLKQTPTVTRSLDYFSKQQRVHVMLHNNREVIVEVPSIGLTVRCTERQVTLQPSSYFRARLCGLCGNYNGDRSEEYQDPSRYIHQSPESFAVSYLRPSQKCDVASYRQHYPTQSTCQIQYQHDIFDYGLDKCISMEPLAVCSKGCRRSKQYTKTVKYYCANRDLTSTKQLISHVLYRPSYHLVKKDVSETKLITMASQCQPDY